MKKLSKKQKIKLVQQGILRAEADMKTWRKKTRLTPEQCQKPIC